MKRNGYFLITVCLALAALFLTACPNTAGGNLTPTPAPTPAPGPADLSSLMVSAGTLSPAFIYWVTAYTVNVPNAAASITLTGAATVSGATLSANNGVAQSLNEGANTIAIRVTAADGTTTKDYVVTVNRSYDYVSPAIGALIYVPKGTFQRDGTSTNTSTVSAFRMSQNEITRAQFLAIMGTDPSDTAYSSGTSDPVQKANWYHAIAFCNKLSLAEGLTTVYSVSGVTDWAALSYASIPTSTNSAWDAATAAWDNEGYRLPTEMEWMWAAMGAPADGQGGGTNTSGYLKAFAGSTGINAIGDYAWYGDNSGGTTHPVGTSLGPKLPNELDLYDMSGNVWEWNWDWFSSAYPTGAVTDYRGAAAGMSSGRSNRGGSWISDYFEIPLENRGLTYPFSLDGGLGFRVSRR
jgi:formylglycine-generating enzyme required for sulfatase activity